MIVGDSKEDLENKKMNVRSFLDAMGMQGIPLMFEQEKVLKSIPFFLKYLHLYSQKEIVNTYHYFYQFQ